MMLTMLCKLQEIDTPDVARSFVLRAAGASGFGSPIEFRLQDFGGLNRNDTL